MADEANHENVMSVELAIRRELAYRRKVASFHPRSNHSMEDLMPLQVKVPSLNPSKTTRQRPVPSPTSGSSVGPIPAVSYKVQASSPNAGPLPTPSWFQCPNPGPRSMPSPSQGRVPYGSSYKVQASSPNPGPLPTPSQFPCPNPGPRSMPSPSQGVVPYRSASNSQPTQMPFPAPSQIPIPRSLARPSSRPLSSRSLVRPSLIPRPFLSGVKRKATTGNLQYLPPKQPQPSNSHVTIDPVGNFFCKACQVPCSGPENLKQHLKGHKHKAKMQWLQMSKRKGEGTEGTPHCELCQVWCMNGDALEMHLNGKNHQAKVRELEYGRESGRGKELPPRCELCQIWCMNEDALQQHLKGKNHITRLYAIEGKMVKVKRLQ